MPVSIPIEIGGASVRWPAALPSEDTEDEGRYDNDMGLPRVMDMGIGVGAAKESEG
jgi:hypothetical protein